MKKCLKHLAIHQPAENVIQFSLQLVRRRHWRTRSVDRFKQALLLLLTLNIHMKEWIAEPVLGSVSTNRHVCKQGQTYQWQYPLSSVCYVNTLVTPPALPDCSPDLLGLINQTFSDLSHTIPILSIGQYITCLCATTEIIMSSCLNWHNWIKSADS